MQPSSPQTSSRTLNRKDTWESFRSLCMTHKVTSVEHASPGSRAGAAPQTRLRLAVVWTEVPAYLLACLTTLVSSESVDLMVISDLPPRPAGKTKHFDASLFSWIPQYHCVTDPSARQRGRLMCNLLAQFKPDVVLLAFQWRGLESYRVAAQAKKLGALLIGTMDNAWKGSLRQRCFSAVYRTMRMLPLDALWVPGDGAATYGRRLFGSRIPIWKGLYCADDSLFCAAYKARQQSCASSPAKSFLYVGRFSEEKGLCDLISAYRAYSAAVSAPCKLVCVGAGPERERLLGVPGVEVKPFAQPQEVARIMEAASVFVLPSHFEPWGVVLHEAALAGLAVICTNECGASSQFVRDGVNGFTYRAGNVQELTERLMTMHSKSDEIDSFAAHSAALGSTLTTHIWADQFIANIGALRNRSFRYQTGAM